VPTFGVPTFGVPTFGVPTFGIFSALIPSKQYLLSPIGGNCPMILPSN
jgi:hypothetical protein